jgi:hypothetical protein
MLLIFMWTFKNTCFFIIQPFVTVLCQNDKHDSFGGTFCLLPWQWRVYIGSITDFQIVAGHEYSQQPQIVNSQNSVNVIMENQSR